MRELATGALPAALGGLIGERAACGSRPDMLAGVSIDTGEIAAAVDDLARMERHRIELLQDFAAADAAAGRPPVVRPADIADRRVRLALVEIAGRIVACLPRDPAIAA
jgi:hypothetical protein